MGATGPSRGRRCILGCVALLGLSATFASAEPPAALMDVFRIAVEALAAQDLDRFMEQFDAKMPGYAELQQSAGALLATDGVSSTIEPVTDEGNAERQQVQVDWLLRTAQGQSRRQVIKCTLEKRGRSWKIVALEPVSFFKFD